MANCKGVLWIFFFLFLMVLLEDFVHADPEDVACLSGVKGSILDPANKLTQWTGDKIKTPCNGTISELEGVTCNNERVFKLSFTRFGLGGTISLFYFQLHQFTVPRRVCKPFNRRDPDGAPVSGQSCSPESFCQRACGSPMHSEVFDLLRMDASYVDPMEIFLLLVTGCGIRPWGNFNGMKNSKSKSAKSWSLSDPEVKRRKRVASYKVYAVEDRVKASFLKSFRWIKDKYTNILQGW